MLRKRNASVFVDWNSQQYNAGQAGELRPARRVEKTIDFIIRAAVAAVKSIGDADIYQMELRLYHGWHRGLTKTENRRELERQIASGLVPLRSENVSVDWRSPFGDRLLNAFDHRLCRGRDFHLPDTMRADLNQQGREREKMVDVALAADLLAHCRGAQGETSIVLAEDDDVIPAIFVAEKWSQANGSQCRLVRRREDAGHLRLEGLLLPLSALKL